MNRCLAFVFALLCASLSVASACTASPADWVSFRLDAARNGSEIRASFSDDDRGRDRNNWSTGFPPSQLVGLDVARFRGGQTGPLQFAVIREAGRLDCSGQGGRSHATGNCAFTPDPRFTQLLESRGIRRPTRREALGLMAVDAKRELIDALAASRYPTPDIDDLMALSALGVDARYIGELAQLGYRPGSLDHLVQFKALNITSAYVAGFARIGYPNLRPDDLVQLRALGVTPEYVLGFQRIGYRNLPVNKLVELKALNITPEFVRAVETRPGVLPPIEQLAVLQEYANDR